MPARKPAQPPIKIMVASTIYGFEPVIQTISATLKTYGYRVLNSHLGTVFVDPAKSNLDNCLGAVEECDLFLGIIRPKYGTGLIHDVSITHHEINEAIRLNKPRWFLVHRDVVFLRQILKKLYTVDPTGNQNRNFKIDRNDLVDNLNVVTMYEDALQLAVPLAIRTNNWVQEFYQPEDIYRYVDSQFSEVRKIRTII